jgi:hypothetical protein
LYDWEAYLAASIVCAGRDADDRDEAVVGLRHKACGAEKLPYRDGPAVRTVS